MLYSQMFTIPLDPASNLKGDPAMESTERTELQILREMVGRLAGDCTDKDLLELICKLLILSGG